jgi:integrase
LREVGKLTALRVSKIGEPGRYGDGGGLWLQVSPLGTKAWIFRYKFLGRQTHMGLGPLADISLADARARARAARVALLDGIDPLAEKRQRRATARSEAAKLITFKAAAEQFIAAHKAGWKNEKHAAQWPSSFEAYAYPVIDEVSVAAIDTALVLKILEPIWQTKTETAARLRGRIEAVLDWARARHYRDGDNPARWKGHLDHLLPSKAKLRRVQHQPALPFIDVPSFMAQLRGIEAVSARALELTILTAVRTGAATGANWSEIDLVNNVWTIPGARAGTKLRQGEHRVPLSKRAVEILRDVPREKGNEHVFIGGKKGKGLTNMAMLGLLQRRHPDLTVHGFRSTFKDWASETTNFPDIVSEMALAHVIKDEVQAAYRRGELMEKRRRLMQAWDGYCARPATPAEIVQLRGRSGPVPA